MKKLALFLEGQTERLFVQSLVEFCGTGSNVRIQPRWGHLGRKQPRKFYEIDGKKMGTGEEFFVLIHDCGTDNRVVSDIRDNYEGLVRENYSMIIGLQDVYPNFIREDIGRLRTGLRSTLADLNTVKIEFYLSIMEIEAWFLAENTHFHRISPRLTKRKITDVLGYFPDNRNVESRDIPSDDLDEVLNIVGKKYDKSRGVVEEIVRQLDFEDIVTIHSAEIEDLGGVVRGVRDFFLIENDLA